MSLAGSVSARRLARHGGGLSLGELLNALPAAVEREGDVQRLHAAKDQLAQGLSMVERKIEGLEREVLQAIFIEEKQAKFDEQEEELERLRALVAASALPAEPPTVPPTVSPSPLKPVHDDERLLMQVAAPPGAKFDPNTGQPIVQAPAGAKFDPNTGLPLSNFDPETGARLVADPAALALAARARPTACI